MMKRTKQHNLFQFLKGFDLTDKAVHFVKKQVDFNLDLQIPQRKLVEMGKIIGRVISLNQVLDLGDKGFKKELIDGSVTFLQQEITRLMSSFNFKNTEKVVDGYDENTSWMNFVAG